MKFMNLTAKPSVVPSSVHRSARYLATSNASTMRTKAPTAKGPSAWASSNFQIRKDRRGNLTSVLLNHAVESTTKLEQIENIINGLWITVD